MKKTLALFIAVLLSVSSLSACGSGGSQKENEAGKIRIVATVFPEYDWVLNVLGDDPFQAEVSMLLDSGVDIHSFQPSAADILKMTDCDLFIYVGGESDEWVADALKGTTKKDMTVISLMDVLGDAVKEEDIIEGMQKDPEEEDEKEYDEHVWLSLRNAALFTESIAAALQKIDPDHAETYKKNSETYIEKLDTLDAEYQSAVSNASVRTLLFGDRFPFRYLVDDYGLNYYAAFAGCSAETEASFETITFLAEKINELSLKAVMTIEGNDHRIAETIIRNTRTKDQQILTLDSMQAASAKDMEQGMTYLSIMEKNLSVLKDALK